MKQNIENYKGCPSPTRDRPHDKYSIEVQVCGSILMKNKFTSTQAFGHNPFSEDILKIDEIFNNNLTKMFQHRIQGFEMSSVRLTKFHFTKADKQKSEEIEAKTKREIIEMIIDLAKAASVEEEYMDNVMALAKETKKKQFLIDLYNEVLEDKLKLELEIHD